MRSPQKSTNHKFQVNRIVMGELKKKKNRNKNWQHILLFHRNDRSIFSMGVF